jgi:Fe-Mn family superoxide dismutase
MAYEAKNFDPLIQACRGFLSEKQLRAHFKLYQGYVKKLNEIETRLGQVRPDTANYSFGDYSELLRREPVAYNGTVLHELYFTNLGPPAGEPPAAFRRAVESAFGSFDRLIEDIKAILQSGHGWCQVLYDWNFNRLRTNFIQSEHHVGLLPNQTTLLALDGWEHAYFMDYGTAKEDYVAGLLKHLNWPVIESRLALTPLSQQKAR